MLSIEYHSSSYEGKAHREYKLISKFPRHTAHLRAIVLFRMGHPDSFD
jgi:hypothetical protein